MDADRARRVPAGTPATVSVRPWADQRGAAFAEFVVMLPIVIGILFGVVILGQGLATKMAVMAAARSAAREYAVTGNSAQALAVAQQEMADAGFATSEGNPAIEVTTGTLVTVTLAYRLHLPFAGSALPGVPAGWTIPGRAVFRSSR